MLSPKSSWPRELYQRYYSCASCGELSQTCELQFVNGTVEPTVGETLTGGVSGDAWVVISTELESGSWDDGTAAGTVYLSKS
jgi:hypothetical protein